MPIIHNPAILAFRKGEIRNTKYFIADGNAGHRNRRQHLVI